MKKETRAAMLGDVKLGAINIACHNVYADYRSSFVREPHFLLCFIKKSRPPFFFPAIRKILKRNPLFSGTPSQDDTLTWKPQK